MSDLEAELDHISTSVAKAGESAFLLTSRGTTLLTAIAAFSFLVFLSIASLLFGQHRLVMFDKDIILAVRTGASAQETLFAMYVTFLGSAPFITAATTAMVLILLMRRRFLTAAFIFNCGAIGALMMVVAKITYMRARPDVLDAFMLESGYSFPSGHAMCTTCFYGSVLFLLLTRLKSSWQRVVACCTYVIVICAVMWSRIYLGVHYPSDIVGGFFLGLCWLCVSLALLGVMQRRTAKGKF